MNLTFKDRIVKNLIFFVYPYKHFHRKVVDSAG